MQDNPAETLLFRKLRRYLMVEYGKRLPYASVEEVYQSLCKALKEEIMIHWVASSSSIRKHQPRILFYLSMEYLPGGFTNNNLVHIGVKNLVGKVLQQTPFTLQEVLHVEKDPGLGNGGLGRLASCFLDSLAALQMPAIGYGLRYQYGIFDQEIWDGVQVERPDRWLLRENPWEFRRDDLARYVEYSGGSCSGKSSTRATSVRAIAYDYPIIGFPSRENDFSVVTLRLWSTKESPRNFALQSYNAGEFGQAGENTSLTDVLYPSDHHLAGKRIRLKQEFLLVSASLQDIFRKHFSRGGSVATFADKVRIQVNDTHPGLVIPELMRLLMEQAPDLSLEEALAITRSVTSYTNHTILQEALEEWDEEKVEELLPRQYALVKRLHDTLTKDKQYQEPDLAILHKGRVRMAHLLLHGSHRVNGVAQLHSDIVRNDLFPKFAALYPEKFCNVTNGVSHRKWLLEANPELAHLLTQRIGDGWIYDFAEVRKLIEHAEDPSLQEEFLAIKARGKEKMFSFLQKKGLLRDAYGSVTSSHPLLGPDALFSVQIKRIHEYKRQLLHILHLVALYLERKEGASSGRIARMALIGGKAAPGYKKAKDILRFASLVSRKLREDLQTKDALLLLVLENYNVSKTMQILPGVDLSEQISLAGKEASGTGNMKLAMNGALTIGTDDGANVEMRQEVGGADWPFCFGMSAEEAKQAREGYDPKEIYEQDPLLKQALDWIVSSSFTTVPEERECALAIRDSLLEGDATSPADPYFVLKDFRAYYEAQQRVETLFQNRPLWAKHALKNIAGMGSFSSDRSIRDYAKIWELTPCPVDQEILHELSQEFSFFSGG